MKKRRFMMDDCWYNKQIGADNYIKGEIEVQQ